MRKVFIGCGVLVVLVLGALGWISYRLYPAVKQAVERSNASIERLNDLERLHPFDPETQLHLDTERFTRALRIRADFGDFLQRAGDTLDTMRMQGERAGEDGHRLGGFEQVGAVMSLFGDVLTEFADQLDAAGMSWPEYAWYTRVVWGVLYRLDKLNIADPGLEPLRNEYTKYAAYHDEQAKRTRDMPKLEELVRNIPLPVLTSAEQVMVANLPLVQRGLGTTGIDHVLMIPVNSLDQLSAVHVAPPGEH